MIDAQITEDHALIRVVSGALDVTYEVKPPPLYSRRRGWYQQTGKKGYALDLAGMTRDTSKQAPYIFGALDFERVVGRALSKARNLERKWRNTRSVRQQVAA